MTTFYRCDWINGVPLKRRVQIKFDGVVEWHERDGNKWHSWARSSRNRHDDALATALAWLAEPVQRLPTHRAPRPAKPTP